MYIKEILTVLMVTLFFPICATAEIGLSYGFYNGMDEVSVSLEGDNLDFESSTDLEPDSFSYKNGGESTDPSAHYSYSIFHNGDPLEARVSTDSGFFSWHTEASSDNSGSGEETFKMAAKSGVINGDMEMFFRNPYSEYQSQVSTTNAAFIESTTLNPERIGSSGRGATVGAPSEYSEASEDSSDTSEQEIIKEVDHTITFSEDKSSSINTHLKGDAEFVWASYVISDPDNYKAGMGCIGVSNGDMEKLEMIGTTTGFPTQILPPGDVEATLRYDTDGSSLSDDARIDDFFNHVKEEQEAFTETYQQTSPTLGYVLRNLAFINPYDDSPSEIPDYYDEIYSMKMVFEVGDN